MTAARPVIDLDGGSRLSYGYSTLARRPQRIQWNRFMGVPLPDGAKLITRPGKYGNPWKITDGSRTEVVERFRTFLADRSTQPNVKYPSDADIIRDLTGYDLACACDYSGPCHGDVLISHIETLHLLAAAGGGL